MEFSWAENHPEVYKICTLFNLTEISDPVKYCYKSLPSFIQDGPQCGVVALAMYIGSPTTELVKEIVDTAKKLGFTNHGEMFSARDMQNLAETYLCKSNLFSGNLDCEQIRECLLSGSCLLVPFDSDKDNSPSLQNGRKAHWAAVCGGIQTDDNFYVLARHGKAKNVAVWKLSDLAQSNAQLNEVGPYPKLPDVKFKLPEGGLNGPLGLSSKAVILTERL